MSDSDISGIGNISGTPIITFWNNGLTHQRQQGHPPFDWVLADDGYWYPPSVTTEPPTGTPIEVPTPPTSATIILTTHINVKTMPSAVVAYFNVNISVNPQVPVFEIHTRNTPSTLHLVPIPMNLRDSMIAVLKNVINGKIENYFDATRRGKTLLNFGDDFQTLLTNWQYASTGSATTMQVKLYQPLPDEVELKTQLWVTRELSPPVLDRVVVRYTPPPPAKIYLRPLNKNAKVKTLTGAKVENVTLRGLLTTSSLDLVRPTDPVVQEWFTNDVNSVELNIDYADYRNFVFFGSAQSRVKAFVNKLLLIEDYDRTLLFNSASLSGTGSAYITGSVAYPALQNISDKRIEILRSFDGYERFLYYGSGSAYSSSLNTNDYEDELAYASDATWPKVNGSVTPVASASAWIFAQLVIADNFDSHNQNYLANNLPAYLTRDTTSREFITFVDMIGHHFDAIKVYIDHMPQIFDRDSDPNIGLSHDLAWNIAEAFGIDMPNQYAIKTLVDYTIGRQEAVTTKVYREIAAETWKRFMHNQIFMLKTKGTRTALQALINTYGILPTTLQIRESATPGSAFPSGTFEIYDDQTNALNIPSSSYIQIPWTATSSVSSSTIEIRFATTVNSTNSVILNADNKWAIRLEPLSGSYGRITAISGSTTVVSSSYLPLYSGDFYSLMLRQESSGVNLQVKQIENGYVEQYSTTTETSPQLSPIWYSPSYVYLGGSGSLFGQGFSGFIDEFRMWNEQLTDATFDSHVRYPGMYNGNSTTSARDKLNVRLSFNIPKNLGLQPVLYNEAPSHRSESFNAINFPNISSAPYNMEIVVRENQRFAANAGASQYSTNKVVIADPPVLKYFGNTDIPILSPNQSIVSVRDKQDYGRSTNIVGLYFSITDAINDSIIRSIGNIDLQSLIGDPAYQYSSSYSDLVALDNLYWSTYAYNYNVNTFVDFVKNLLDPLFTQAKNLVPARVKLLAGIVHEPHILERSKIQTYPVSVSAGALTRENQTETLNLEAAGQSTLPVTVGENDTVEIIFSVPQEYEVVAENDGYETLVDTSDILLVSSDAESYESDITMTDIMEVSAISEEYDTNVELNNIMSLSDAEYNVFDDRTNFLAWRENFLETYHAAAPTALSPSIFALYTSLLHAYRSPLTIDIVRQYTEVAKKDIAEVQSDGVTNVILPYTNFDTLEATTYFNRPSGSVIVPSIQYVLTNSASLHDRGNWTVNTIYSRNDLVLQINQEGNAVDGNNIEFVCVSPDTQFTSSLAPYLDTRNWRQATYIPQRINTVKKAAVISGSVSLVSTGSIYPAAQEYRPEHFVFSRDKRQGTIRHQWLGCVQDNTTTTDGKSPIEITISAGSELIVRNPGEPVKPTNSQDGPILDIR